MRKCFTINCMRGKDDFDGYEIILKNNLYQGIEIFYPYNVDDEQKKYYSYRVNKIKNEINPEIVLHLPHGPLNDLLGNNKVTKEEVYERMTKAIDYAAMFSVKKLTLHLGSYQLESSRVEAINKVCTIVSSLCDYASNKDMNIMIENMPSYNELGYSPEEILYIIKRVNKDNLKFILDTGHANCSKYDLVEYVTLLSDYLYHMHFNDNNGMRDEHKRVNSGNIDFEKLFEKLSEVGYSNLHCMEVLFKTYKDLIEYEKDISVYERFY